MKLLTINKIDYIEFKANVIGLDSRGRFDLEALPHCALNSKPVALAHNILSETEPSNDTFGLPEFTSGCIAGEVQTIRMRKGTARELGLLWNSIQWFKLPRDVKVWLRTAPDTRTPESKTSGKTLAYYETEFGTGADWSSYDAHQAQNFLNRRVRETAEAERLAVMNSFERTLITTKASR